MRKIFTKKVFATGDRREMPKYLVTFAQTKEEFRIHELIALCKYFDVKLSYEPDAYRNDVSYPSCIQLTYRC